MSLGKRIQSLRKQRNMTQEQLAEKLNITRQAVSSWESDKNQPDIETIVKLADLFHVTVDHLVREKPFQVVQTDVKSQKNDSVSSIPLMILTSIFMAVVLIMICCLCSSVTSVQYNEYTDYGLERIFQPDDELISDMDWKLHLNGFKEQSMLAEGYIVLQDTVDFEDGSLVIIYEDLNEEKISFLKKDEHTIQFNRTIPAKNIMTIQLTINDIQREEGNAIPVEDIMYTYRLRSELIKDGKDYFKFKVSPIYETDHEDLREEIDFSYPFEIINEYKKELDPLNFITNLEITVYKDDSELQTFKIDKKYIDTTFVIGEPYYYSKNYDVFLSYQTPLGNQKSFGSKFN